MADSLCAGFLSVLQAEQPVCRVFIFTCSSSSRCLDLRNHKGVLPYTDEQQQLLLKFLRITFCFLQTRSYTSVTS